MPSCHARTPAPVVAQDSISIPLRLKSDDYTVNPRERWQVQMCVHVGLSGWMWAGGGGELGKQGSLRTECCPAEEPHCDGLCASGGTDWERGVVGSNCGMGVGEIAGSGGWSERERCGWRLLGLTRTSHIWPRRCWAHVTPGLLLCAPPSLAG